MGALAVTSIYTEAANEVVAAARTLAEAGLSPGQSGNISCRVGSDILMSPTNSNLAALDPTLLSVLTMDGHQKSGPQASKELAVHLSFYRRNASHSVVIHLHSPHAVAFSCLRAWTNHHALPPYTPYIFLKVGQVPLLNYRMPGDSELAQLIDSSPFEFHGALLANHGQVVSGESFTTAINAAIEIEETARVALLLHNKDAELLSEADIESLIRRSGKPWSN